MAINPLISMQGASTNIGDAVASGVQSFQNAQAIRQRQPLIDAQVDAAASASALNDVKLSREEALFQIGDAAYDAVRIKPLLESDPARAIQSLDARIQKITDRDGNPEDTIALRDGIASGSISAQQAISELDSVIKTAVMAGVLKDPSTTNGYGTSATFFRDPSTGRLVAAQGSQSGGFFANGKPIPAEFEPVASPNTIYAQDMQNYRLGIQPIIAGRTRETEAAVDIRTKPQIAAAETAAKEGAKADVDRTNTARSNSTAMNVYETGMSNLLNALGDTATGPVAGRLPAVTANQQIADGANAAMAPVLKQMFRIAGEGVFTDKDQELLLKMLPDRKDHPEAAKAKIQGVDAIVRAKLGQGGQAMQQSQPTQGPEQQGPKPGESFQINGVTVTRNR